MPNPATSLATPVFQPIDENGDVYINGQLETYLSGTSTPLAVFQDSGLTQAHQNPVVMDAAGRAIIFLGPSLYKFVMKDNAGVVQWTVDPVGDLAQINFATFSQQSTEGSKGVATGYEILQDDHLVTVDSGPGPATVNLHRANIDRIPLVVKNIGANTVTIAAFAGDNIDTAATFVLPAAAGAVRPTVVLLADGTVTWYVEASHKVP